MAQVKDGINGIVSGKAGSNVFYTMYGKNYVRTVPHRKKRQKPTEKQLRQRQRMALVQSFLQPFKELIKISFASITVGNAPYHVAKSYNLLHAIKGDAYPEQEIDWSKTYLSAGSLDLPESCYVEKGDDGLLFNWSAIKGRFNDTLLVIAYSPQLNHVDYRFSGVSRCKNEFLWDVKLGTHDVHVWIAFRSADEKMMSDSMYLGKV